MTWTDPQLLTMGECPNEPDDPVGMDMLDAFIAAMGDLDRDTPIAAQDSASAADETLPSGGEPQAAGMPQTALGEAKYSEPLHPRGRGGRWVETLFHGTDAKLKPGDIVTPAGHERQGEDLPTHYDPTLAYATTGGHLAERYAVAKAGKTGTTPHVYEVTPVGEVQLDPEAVSGFGTDQRAAKAFRVEKEVPLPGLTHWGSTYGGGFGLKRGPAPDASVQAVGAAKPTIQIAPAQGDFINWTGKHHKDPVEVSDASRPLVLNALDQGRVVGSILAAPDEDDPQVLVVESVWVAPTHRRQGIGQRLITAAKQQIGAQRVIGMPQSDAGGALLSKFTAPSVQAVTAPASAFKEGDRVVYQHGMLGKLDARVTRVRGDWPKQKIDVSYKVDGEPRSTVLTTDQAAVKLERKLEVQAVGTKTPGAKTFDPRKYKNPQGQLTRELRKLEDGESLSLPGGHTIASDGLTLRLLGPDGGTLDSAGAHQPSLMSALVFNVFGDALTGPEGNRLFWSGSETPRPRLTGAAYFLGDLPVSVGQSSPDSPLHSNELRAYGDAIRQSVERHPEILNGRPPLKRVTFLSEPEWADLRPQLRNIVLAVAYRPQWGEQRLIVNDLRPFPVAGPGSNWPDHAPSTQVPLGTMGHEMGHAFAQVHGYGERGPMVQLFSDFGITPQGAATVSTATGGDIRESFAELYAQQFTPGFQIQDHTLREAFLAMIDYMRRADGDIAQAGGDAVVTNDPEIAAEMRRARAENLRTNSWDAPTPLLDALRAALGDDPEMDRPA